MMPTLNAAPPPLRVLATAALLFLTSTWLGAAWAAPPPAPVLVLPVGVHHGLKPAFKFRHVPGVTWYLIWIGDERGVLHQKWYRDHESGCPSGAGDCQLDPGLDLAPGRYQWWVRAWNSEGNGPWAGPKWFDVKPPRMDAETLFWINPNALAAGDETLAISFRAGADPDDPSAVLLESSVADDPAGAGGARFAALPLSTPPGFKVRGVRVCYRSSSEDTRIERVAIRQLQEPPLTVETVLREDADLNSTEPVCADTTPMPDDVDPAAGSLELRLGVHFAAASPGERIEILALGLNLVLDPGDAAWAPVTNHTHKYLTGRGEGHNNTQAVTGPAIAR